jgi:hypothetical protein
MSKFELIGAAALSLAFAFTIPAMARDAHRVSGAAHGLAIHHYAYSDDRDLPIENALRWGYSQGYRYYPSGFGGLYGDGLYPGNVISNYRPQQ